MEVDILNDLLTRTVSSLFSNKMKHMSYLSEDDGNKQEEIFPQQEPVHHINHNNQKANLNTHNINHSNNNNNNNNNQNEQPRKNIIEKIINNNMNNKNNKQNNQNQPEVTNPKTWCMTVGKKKYEESLHRLQINERMIASRTLINEMSLEQLTNEKARVKQELKKYDEDFFQVFKSKPTKENKEIMKPLYYYYQKLKLAISKKTSDQASNASTVAETIVRNDKHGMNNNSNNQSIFPSTMTDNTENNIDNESIITQEVTYGNNTELISNTSDISNSKPKKNTQPKGVFQAFAGEDAALLDALKEYDQHRKLIKHPMTDGAKKRLITRLQNFPREQWVAILHQSIDKGWQDIYELKEGENNGTRQNKPVHRNDSQDSGGSSGKYNIKYSNED